MTLEIPLWMQAKTYPARLDRRFIEAVMRRQSRVFTGLKVTQRGAGANFSVDISIGDAVVIGNSQANQGGYYVASTAIENRTVPATPASNRTDSVILKVRDPNAGGEAGDDWVIEAISGTTVPANSILLASLARTPAEGAILNSAITDTAPRGEWAWTVSTSAPTGRGVPGDLWVVV